MTYIHTIESFQFKTQLKTLTSPSVGSFIQKAVAFSRRVEIIAHKLLVTFSKGFGNVYKVVRILG